MKPKTLTTAAVLTSRPLRSKIAARAECDERAVQRAYSGHPMHSDTHERVTAAAEALGLPIPHELVDVHRRTHSASGSVRCEICAPLWCEKAK